MQYRARHRAWLVRGASVSSRSPSPGSKTIWHPDQAPMTAPVRLFGGLVFAGAAALAFRSDSAEPLGYGFSSRLLTDPAKKLHPQSDPAGREVMEALLSFLFADPYGLCVLLPRSSYVQPARLERRRCHLTEWSRSMASSASARGSGRALLAISRPAAASSSFSSSSGSPPRSRPTAARNTPSA